MGDLTYLIIFLVVINLVGRIIRALQKSAGQQPQGGKPKAKPQKKQKGPFEVLAERLEELGQIEKERPSAEEPPPHPYVSDDSSVFEPEIAAVETPESFALETAATIESEFESKPRSELHEETFPWQETQRYEYSPPVKPVTPAPGPELVSARSYRGDVIGMLQDPESVRNAVLLGTILGPCRARVGRYRFRGPR